MQRFMPLLALALVGAKLPDDVAILPESEPIELCSRPPPAGLTARRKLSAAEVIAADRALKKLAGSLPSGRDRYLRQYLGIVQGDRAATYINAFQVWEPSDPATRLWLKKHNDPNAWRKHFAAFCDGGDGAWGVVYHPDTGQFDNFQIDGTIGGPGYESRLLPHSTGTRSLPSKGGK